MEMKDPAPGQAWAPQQFWTCARCGRHFWTTYTTDPNVPPAQKPGASASGPASDTAAPPSTP